MIKCTRKQMTWQQRRMTGRHLAHRIRGVTGRLHSDTRMVQVISDKFRSTGGYQNPPGKLLGLMGLMVEERRQAKVWHAPLGPNRIGLGLGGGPPFPSLLPLLPSSPTWTRKGGNLLLLGVGIPPWARPLWPALLLLPSFIYGGRGHPIDTQVDL